MKIPYKPVRTGRALHDAFPESRAVFEGADAALGFSISKLCFEGPAEDLQLTANTQPAILTASVAAFQALVEHVPSRLTVIGADPEDLSRLIADPELLSHIDVLGKVSDSVLWRHLGDADLRRCSVGP